MALNTVTTGNTVLASDVNQMVNVLQRSAGQTETGKYFLTAPAYVSSASIGAYIGSESRGATTVSVSVDSADQAPSGVNAPNTDHLTANGFHIFTTSTGVVAGCNVGGNYTIQYIIPLLLGLPLLALLGLIGMGTV